MHHDLFDSIESERNRIKLARVKGTVCACCSSFLKLYKRKLNVSMCVVMIHLYKYPKDSWIEVEKMIRDHNLPTSFRADFHKATFWRLIEAKDGERIDGNPNLGLYRLTAKGRIFVHGDISIPEYALIYRDKLEGFSEKMVYIRDALKNKFSYEDLMSNS